MRRLIFITALVMGVAASGSALANYVFPGRVIIGTQPPPPPPPGTTTNAMVMSDPCMLEAELDCECFPGVKLLDACEQGGTKIGCLTHDMPYLYVKQSEPVLLQTGEQVLGALVCTNKSKSTAHVVLPYKGE